MKILSLTSGNFLQILTKFITPYEASCVQLGSYLRKQSQNIFFLQQDDEILGLLYVESTVFHCLPDLSKIDQQELKSFLIEKSQNRRIKCISGKADGTDFLVNLLRDELSSPFQLNHYNLMTCTSPTNPATPLSNDDEILRCAEPHLEALLPIQKQYMQTEVATQGRQVTDAEVSIGLRLILKNQLCLALFSDGEPVAKANTNAIGLNWVQIGGVYTHPLYRRNGYACHLVSAICRRTAAAGKNTALFVKDINVPAIELYKKIGFSKSGLYTIAYF